jgi:DNA-binding beta-propeller fold protein YncE
VRNTLARILLLICPMGLFGLQGSETIILPKGTHICLVSSQRISTRTAEVGRRVLFRVGQDVLAPPSAQVEHGSIIIPNGAEVWATIQQVQRPENWARDGKLSFAFESVPLGNGKTVSLRALPQPKTSVGQNIEETWELLGFLTPVVVPFLPLMAFEKGQEPVLTKNTCITLEIADEVVLTSEEVLARQKASPDHIPDLIVEQIQVPQRADVPPPTPGSQPLVTEFNLPGSLRSVAFTPGAIWFSGPSGLIRVDAYTHKVVNTIPTGAPTAAITPGFGAVWAADVADKAVLRIDPENNQITTRIPLEEKPMSIMEGEGSIWITNAESVSRIDPQTNRVVAAIHLEGQRPHVLAIGEGSVWATIPDKRSIVRIDSQTNTVIARIRVGEWPTSIALVNHGVWVADNSGITHIDPKTNETRKISSLLAPAWPFHLTRKHVGAYSLIAHNDDLWAVASDETIVRINAKAEKVTAYIRVPPRKDFFQLAPVEDGRPSGLAVAGDFAWVSDFANQVLWRIDTRTNKVAPEPVLVGFKPIVVGKDNLGRIWVANSGDGTFMEIQP